MGRTQPNSSDGRLAYVDGWRGVAILLVLLTHAWSEADAPALSFHVGSHTVALAAVPAIGYVGVNLFLVLSGLCLAYPFMRDPSLRDRTTIWSFWRRRVRRIVPAYYLSMLAVLGLWAACRAMAVHMPRLETLGAAPMAAPPTLANLGSHLFFLHNLRPDHASAINGSYWSLALEFQLYLLFPLLLEAVFRWGPWRVAGVLLAIQLAYRFTLDLLLWDPALQTMTTYAFVAPKAILGRMFDFATGMAVAHVIARQPRFALHAALTGPWAGATGITALLTAFVMKVSFGHALVAYSIEDVLWAIGFGLLVCWTSRTGAWGCRMMSFRPLVWIGLISYSIYLIHQPLLICASRLCGLHFKPGTVFVSNVLFIPLVIGASAAFYACCEAPFLRKPQRAPRAALVPEPAMAS